MQFRQTAGEGAVHLLGKRRIPVIGAQSGLHMAHRRLLVKGAQSRRKGGGGISMDQHDVRPALFHYLGHPFHHPGGDGCQSLALFHDIQVVIRPHRKNIQYLVQHLPMLAGDADHTVKFRPLGQFLYQRTHLDRFRACAKHRQHLDLFHISSSPEPAVFRASVRSFAGRTGSPFYFPCRSRVSSRLHRPGGSSSPCQPVSRRFPNASSPFWDRNSSCRR